MIILSAMSIKSKLLQRILGVSAALCCTSGNAGAPPIDLAGASIALERSACFGSCPAYRVTIQGDGRVQFTTDTGSIDPTDTALQVSRWGGVLLPGTHEDRIAPDSVADLIKRFQAADFWRLADEYMAPVTDVSTETLTVVLGEHRKTVVAFGGGGAGMPHAVSDLENDVDRLAGSDRWIVGSPALIPWLEQTAFDFRSRQAAELVVAGEQRGASEATVNGLIDRGAPLDQPVGVTTAPEIAGISLIKAAMKRGHAGLFRRLAADGWLDRLSRVKAAELFAKYAAGCSPTLVDAVADAGVDIDRVAPTEAARYTGGAQCQTALAVLSSGTCESTDNKAALVPTAERLLDRGANPNHRDSFGRTPLYYARDSNLVNLLVTHGADPVAESEPGQCSSP